MKKKIIGVRRGNQYSPNHIGNDAAIFNLTAENLRKKGYEVSDYSETEFLNEPSLSSPFIFNMARDKNTIQKLQGLEGEGSIVVNSGYGIENCTREKMTRILLFHDIPHPDSVIVKTDEPLSGEFVSPNKKYWVKRGDFHAIHREDVTFTRNVEETEGVLHEYFLRGIKTAVINEHLEGDLLKFYGVKGTDFFYWFYPNLSTHSKFGWEKINGKAKGIPFDLDYLISLCNKASRALNVGIYGGDAIVSPDGSLKIIDFNDWPSFAPCRVEAASYIAHYINREVSNPEYEFSSYQQWQK